MAAESASVASGCQSALGEMWRYGCPKSPADSWIESDGASSAFREHNVVSLAWHVIGLNWSVEKVSLFLEDWELARVVLSCHVALEMLCQEMHEAW